MQRPLVATFMRLSLLKPIPLKIWIITTARAENHDFDGITVIPFCTSGGSGIGSSGSQLGELAGSGTWVTGERFNSNVSDTSLKAWIDSLE